MKKMYSLLALVAMLFAAVSVSAQKYHLVSMADEPEPGVNYALVNATATDNPYASAVGGLKSVLADDNIVWQLETTGETSDDGYDLYVLKSVGQNAYWQDDDFEGNLGLDGYDLHSYAGTNANWGPKATAIRFTVMKAGSVGHEWRDQGGSNGFILARNKAVTQSDGTTVWYFKLGRQSQDIAFEPYNEDVAWNFYTIEESSPKDKLQELVDNIINAGTTYEISNDPGGYSAERVNAYNAALQAAQTGITQELTDDEYTKLYNDLNDAQANLDQGVNPVVEGYYFVVSGYSAFYEQQGTHKALYASSSTVPRWQSFADSTAIAEKDYSFIWHITPYQDGWKLTSQLYGTDYNGPANNNTDQSAQCFLVQNSTNPVYIRFIGNQNVRIYNSFNSFSLHANGHSSGAGQSGTIVTWNTTGDGASAWHLQTITDQDYINGALQYRAQLQLIEQLRPLVTEANTLYDKLFVSVSDFDSPYITAADDTKSQGEAGNQFLGNRKEASEGSYAALIDGNTRAVWNASGEEQSGATNYGPDGQWAYYHSAWSSVTRVGAHSDDAQDFIQVDVSSNPVQSFVLRYYRRYNNPNAQPTQIAVYATNDTTGFYAGTDTWTKITTLNPPTLGQQEAYVSPVIDLGAKYNYVRFTVEQTNNSVRYFTFSEFNLYPGTTSQELSQYYYVTGMKAAADAMRAAAVAGRTALDSATVTQADIDNLTSAIAAVRALYADTTAVSDAIAQAENDIPLATIGTEIGNIKTQATVDAYQSALTTAKEINLEGAVQKTTLDQALSALTTARNNMLKDMVVPETGKWYFITSQDTARHDSTYTHGSVMYVRPNSDQVAWTANEAGEMAENATAMWKLIAVENDSIPNVFYFQNMATGMYFGNQSISPSFVTLTSATPTPFQILFRGGDNVGIASIVNNTQDLGLHPQVANQTVVGWYNSNPSNAWTFNEVDSELEGVVIPIIAGTKVVTLPFAVEGLADINDGVSTYAVKNMTLNADSTTTVELYSKDSFAAGEPFIAVSSSAEQLLVPTPAADAIVTTPTVANGLVGTFKVTTVGAGKGVFADSTNLSATTATSTSIPAISGYVDAGQFSAAVEGVETALTYANVAGLDWTKAVSADVNGDGVVNSSDVVEVYNYINGTSTVSAATADVNSDGSVNSSDAVEIYNQIAGASASSPAYSVPAAEEYPSVATIVNPSKTTTITIKVGNSDDLKKVPLYVYLSNPDSAMTAVEVNIKGDVAPSQYLEDEEEGGILYDGTERWTRSHGVTMFRGTQLHGSDALFISIVSTQSNNLRGTEGSVITVYFDASQMSEGQHTLTMFDTFAAWTDKHDIVSYFSPDYTETFTIADGKVTGIADATAEEIANAKAIYTLNGTKVTTPLKGQIYVIDGKTVKY